MTSDTTAPADDNGGLALKARDARFDGSFLTSVNSTGIYCRPESALIGKRSINAI